MDDETPKLKALDRLTGLFSANYAQYKSSGYDESNARTDFIDKFFELLDWDVRNEQGFSENYREVIREDKVKIDGQQKAPDYCFRIGGVRKFFVEAKKPGINIKDTPEPAFQVRRYAYTAKLSLSILTNFEEFAVYDTRVKPDKNDKAGTARIFYCTFKEYEQHFDFIRNTFSKNAILKGSFDRYVEENKNKKGTTPIDEDLLFFVEDWRMELAKNIALRNPDISIYNLNTVVQKTIDRILFLRIAESKGIEDADLLKTVSQGINVYEHLNQLFIRANVKYNSGLFKPESWIEQVKIDDKILSNIIVNLYYPDCPYEFSVLPVEILGNIYEKFLGKMIRFKGVKGGHSAVIEEKPEVRKAGGVYYTPQYIVDYIVQNTVGVLIKDKTPDEIAALRFVDPACGSGSFLVGAYQYLLNYHLDYYTNGKNRKAAIKKEKIYEAAHNAYKLTIAEKQQILQNNIYGVDIDSQAVEVTKLSLYLKLLENEGNEASGQLFRFSDMALLPNLDANIRCGNSLIGTDFYAQADLGLTNEEQFKVNCFDWEKEFAAVFKAGGFDAVIGNPPYGASFLNAEQNYLERYTFFEYQVNSFVLFIEKGSSLLKKDGLISFITPATFLAQHYFKKVREYVLGKYIQQVVVLNYKVFKDADTGDTSIFVIKNSNMKEYSFNHAVSSSQDEFQQNITFFSITQQECLSNDRYEIKSSNSDALMKKILSNSIMLNTIATCIMGIKPYQKGKGFPKQVEKIVKDRIFDAESKIDNTYKPYLIGKDIDRYILNYKT
jgi:adenine-specific DNA-methyltransferase